MKETNLTKVASIQIALLFVFCCMALQGFSQSQSTKWTDVWDVQKGNFYEAQRDFQNHWTTRTIEKGKGYKAFKRWEAETAPRVFPSGDLTLTSSTYSNFVAWQNENPSKRLAGGGNGDPTTMSTGNWTSIGPIGKPGGVPIQATGAGRINCIRFDPTNSNTIYVGTPDGGLWKSTNSGTTWTTNTDFLTAIGVSDLAIDPGNTNIMYLATGDIEGDKRSIGVLKSIDGGATWNTTALTFSLATGYRISKLLMNPSNSLNMIVSTNGGIFRTTDGWATSTQTQCCTNFKDMEFKPGDPNTMYAAGSAFFKSTDNGVTWTAITTGLPSSGIQRIALGVTAGNSAYVYALIGRNSDQGFMGMYRSTDSGTSFSVRSTTPNLLGYNINGLDVGGQAFYDLSVAVSPTDPELVTTGGVNHWQSTNGGTNWTIKSYWFGGGGGQPPFVHADIHEITYLPGSSTTFFSCNDGGLFKTTDNGSTWTDLSNNLTIAQETEIGISQTNANLVVAGMQDNGTNLKTTSTWNNIFGGDGGDCFIDHSNNNTIYFSYVYADFYRSDNGGASNTNIVSGLPGGADFYSRYYQDPVTQNTLYAAGFTALCKSTNKGANWSVLATAFGSGNIKGIAVAPSNNSILYAIKSDAVSKSTNAGTSFATNVTGTLPVGSAALTDIIVSNTDPNKAWVCFSGYSTGNKVFRTVDGGTTWTNISTGLPNLPFNTLIYMNNSADDAIYVGGDIGVYYYDNIAATWAPFMTGLPNTKIKDLEIYYATGKIRAGTYGRGTWESDIYTSGSCITTAPSITISTTSNDSLTVCGGTSITLTPVTGAGSMAEYLWFRNGVAINYINGGTGVYTFPAVASAGTNIYTLQVVYTGSNCLTTTSATATIISNAPATPIITTSTGFNNFCAGANFSLSTTAGLGNYEWKRSGVIVGTNSNIYGPVTASGNHTVKVTNAIGCTKTSANIYITRNAAPSVALGVDKNLCIGSSLQIGVANNAANSYAWSPTTALSNSTISNPIANPTTTTSYILTATNTTTLCAKSDTIMLTALSTPVAPTVTSAPVGNMHTFTPNAPGATFVNWYRDGAGLYANKPPTATISVYASSPTKAYTAKSKGSNGCLSAASNTINVRTADTEGEMNIYPNPTEGFLAVDITNFNMKEGNLVLFNLLGQVILEKNVEFIEGKASEILDLRNLSKGIYTLSFQTYTQHYSQKVILE